MLVIVFKFLGFEVELYEDPYERFGQYSFTLQHASPLVVQGSREKRVNYILENKVSVDAEIDQ